MAGSINRVMLIGRLGQDPKLSYLPSGQAVVELSVATDENYKDREGNKVEKTEWHRVKAFGRTAEFCNQYLGKGRLVYVEGSIKTRSWDDQQGQKRYMTEVVVSAPGHTVQALDRGQDRVGQDEQPQERKPAGSQPPGNSGASGRNSYGGRPKNDDLGPAFPSEASGIDDVPFALMLAPLAALALAAMSGGWSL